MVRTAFFAHLGIGLGIVAALACVLAFAWQYFSWHRKRHTRAPFQFRISDALVLVSYSALILALVLNAPPHVRGGFVACPIGLASLIAAWYIAIRVLAAHKWNGTVNRMALLVLAGAGPAGLAWYFSKSGWQGFYFLSAMGRSGGESLCLGVECAAMLGGLALALLVKRKARIRAGGGLLALSFLLILIAHANGFKVYGRAAFNESLSVEPTHQIVRISQDGSVETDAGDTFPLSYIGTTDGFKITTDLIQHLKREAPFCGINGPNVSMPVRIVPEKDGTVHVYYNALIRGFCGNAFDSYWFPRRTSRYRTLDLSEELLMRGWATPPPPPDKLAANQ